MLVATAAAGCAAFRPAPLDNWPDPAVVETQTREALTVSAGLLSDAQAETLYGVDLSDVGLQAIWLSIRNDSPHDYWLLVSSLDPEYYPPDEAVALFMLRLSDDEELAAIQRFRELSMPLRTEAGTVSEGFVLAPRREGGRYLNVPLLGHSRHIAFGFPLKLPDGDFDFERFETEEAHANRAVEKLELDQLRARIRALPCCTRDEDGERNGDPLNLVIVAEQADLLAALSHAGWSFTHRIDIDTVRRLIAAAISGSPYPVAPVSPLYVFGRKQDLALQRARNTIVQRNHIRLWVAPFTLGGRPVWVGQVSRDISLKLTTLSPTLTTHVIDPNVDEAREHLLQSLLAVGVVRRFGFVAGVPPATPQNPAYNLTEDPYFTDGNRLLVELLERGAVALADVEFLDWRTSDDPVDTALSGEPVPAGEQKQRP